MAAPPSLTLPARWRTALIVVVLVVSGSVLASRLGGRHDGSPTCARTLGVPHSPLLGTAGMAAQPDERLDTLAAAVARMPAPFGDVVAGVGYDYDQWLHLYGVSGGVLAWTKNNAPVTFLDPATLKPRWSLRPAGRTTAWDASADTFLLLDLEKERVRVGTFGLDLGGQHWCTDVDASYRPGDPVSTAFLPGGDVLVATKASGGTRLTRLAGEDGAEKWQRVLAGAGRADFLTTLPGDRAIAGGVEEYRLAEPAPTSSADPVITVFSTADGRAVWTWASGAGTSAHVVGVSAGRVLVTLRTPAGPRLLALDEQDGAVLWQRTPQDGAFEATLRGDVVLMRSPAGLDGYRVADGRPVWRLPVPKDRTYFPYGFVLDQMPSLDADRVLVPTTTALLVLDVRTGSSRTYRLPIDGVSTTYWPYQLLVTEELLGVVTNTGGVLARRVPE